MGVKYADCERCPLQGNTVVPGYGCRNSPDIAFVAEAPGETEAEQGRPLVGKAGQFLRMVIRDLGAVEKRCYFTNICLCRPPGNVKPKAAAALACSNRLAYELMAIRPKLVVTLGGLASTHLLQFNYGITRCHGVYRELEFEDGFTVGAIPTYHPSGVLRAPDFFPDFVDELDRALGILNGATPVVDPPYHNYHVVDTQSKLDSFLIRLRRHKWASLDLETTGLNWLDGQILCAGFSWKRGEAYIIDWTVLMQDNLDNIHALDEVFADVKLSFQNGMFDMPWLLQAGFHNTRFEFDTQLAHYLLDERQGTHGLERLAIKYYHAPDYKSQFRLSHGIGLKGKSKTVSKQRYTTYVPDETFAIQISQVSKLDLFMYNGADADYTYRLTVDFAKSLKEEGQIHILRDIELPAAKLFMEFTMGGMLVDQPYWRKMARGWKREMDALEVKLRSFPGAEKINFGSPLQLARYLYDVLKLLPFGGAESFKRRKIDEGVISKCIQSVDDPEAKEYWTSKRTQMSEGLKGFGGESKGMVPRSTSTYMLYWLRQQHEFPGLLIKWKHIQKRFGLYYNGIKECLYSDGRVRPQYDMTATRTGRKATNKPAIHNLPRGDEIYNIYIAPPGWVILHADYSQAELWIMAHYSGSKKLIHLLKTTDVHTKVAQEIFELTPREWKKLDKAKQKNLRIAAKMITFGIPYGRSPAGLAPQLGITKEAAQVYLDTYFELTGLEPWLLKQRAKGVEEHIITSVFNRRRRFPFIRDRYHRREVERQSGNFPVQSGINDLTLIAYVKSVARLRNAGIPAKPWPHIHDSLNILVPAPLWRIAVKIIAEAMHEIPFKTEVEFPVEIEKGARWGELETVYNG